MNARTSLEQDVSMSRTLRRTNFFAAVAPVTVKSFKKDLQQRAKRFQGGKKNRTGRGGLQGRPKSIQLGHFGVIFQNPCPCYEEMINHFFKSLERCTTKCVTQNDRHTLRMIFQPKVQNCTSLQQDSYGAGCGQNSSHHKSPKAPFEA